MKQNNSPRAKKVVKKNVKKIVKENELELAILKLCKEGKIEFPVDFSDELLQSLQKRVDFVVKLEVQKALKKYLKKLMAE